MTGNGGHLPWARVVPQRLAVVLLACVPVLAGCADAAKSDAADVAEQLLAAVADGDGETACSVLSPAARDELEQSSGRPCAQAILEEDLGPQPVRDVHVFNTMAEVRFSDQAVFLARFDGGWRVTAAACTPVPDRPYDCSIQG